MRIIESEATVRCRQVSMAPLAKLLVAVSAILWTAMPAFTQAPLHGKDKLGVMTCNVYEGADLDVAFSAQNQEDFVKAVGKIQASRPPARAAAIAKQIGKAQPTLVSLQEATEWKTCPAD
jgi:hypothetical protein